MKRIIAISGLLGVLGLGVVSAQVTAKDSKVTELNEGKQNKGDHHKRGHKKGSRESRFEKYNLTEVQKSQLKALFEQNKAVKGLAKDQNLTKEQRQKMHEEKRAMMNSEIQKILTQEQYAQFQKDQAERVAHRKNFKSENRKGHHHRKGPKGDFLAKYNLTDAQKAELKTYFEENKPSKDGMKKEDLTKEQRVKMHKERRDAFDQKLQSVLTQDQYAQFKKDQEERKLNKKVHSSKQERNKEIKENRKNVAS